MNPPEAGGVFSASDALIERRKDAAADPAHETARQDGVPRGSAHATEAMTLDLL